MIREVAGVPVVSTAGMTYNPRTRVLVTEVSSHPNLGRVVPAVIDLRSHKTGRVVRFVYSHRVTAGRGEDVETAAWVYRGPDRMTLHVVND